jgi:hypothetical protein
MLIIALIMFVVVGVVGVWIYRPKDCCHICGDLYPGRNHAMKHILNFKGEVSEN